MNVTFTGWLAMGAEARAVVLDALLERLPEGYVHARDVGNEAGVVPQFIHRPSSVLFHLVFGDEVLVGVTPARSERARQVRLGARRPGDAADDADEVVEVSAQETPFTPARRVFVPSMLVGEVLSGHQLQRLGVSEEVCLPWGIRPAGLGATLRALARAGWRAPSEVEWEFAARAAMDSLDDDAPPRSPAMRFLPELGARYELCRDSWHPDWTTAPRSHEGWGEGHQVLRGGGGGGWFASWSSPPAWGECLAPKRTNVADSSRAIAVRPWVSLVD